MPPLSPDVEPQRLSSTAQTLQDDFQARLKTLELQLTLEYQRQRDHVEEELHKLQQQFATMVRDQHQQQQATLTTLRETVDELRQEVAEALHRLSHDVDRVAQHAEAQTSRALERLRHELLAALFDRDQTTVKRHTLGEFLITLGKHLQEASMGEEP